MGTEMSKSKLIEALTSERAAWEALLAEVGEERMTLPAINQGWSVKDAVAHGTYYERWLLEWLEAALRGQVKVATLRDLLSVDQRNAILFRENRNRPLSHVLAESRQVFERLLLVVRLIPEQDLYNSHRFERYVLPFWETNQPLWKCIANNSYEHYAEHSASIRAWLERTSAEPALAMSHSIRSKQSV